MASRIPEWSDIDAGAKPTSEAWLDTLIKGESGESRLDVADTASLQATSSSNPERPRTLRAGYSYNSKVMTVVFRDGTWWEYRNVPDEIWEGFKSSPSKGQYLRSSGLDRWDDMGPANIKKMSKAQRAQMNDLESFTNYMYKS